MEKEGWRRRDGEGGMKEERWKRGDEGGDMEERAPSFGKQHLIPCKIC